MADASCNKCLVKGSLDPVRGEVFEPRLTSALIEMPLLPLYRPALIEIQPWCERRANGNNRAPFLGLLTTRGIEIQGDYMVDRKWAVVNRPRSRAQILRQSEVSAQHRLIGTWEVPTPVEKTKALKLLKQMSITNIHVRVVKP